jgi:hypothetical protein
VLSGNSLRIVVSDDKEEEEKKEKIIEGEAVKREAVEGEKREYIVTPVRSIASIDLIAH